MSKQSSLEIKKQEDGDDVEAFIKRRWLFVHELKSLLDELDDDDWVTPNQVGNLAVEREGHDGLLAAIDFLWVRVDWFNQRENEDE
jgi:hypothetical protein